MRYQPESPPLSAGELGEYLLREHDRIANALINPDPLWDDLRVSLSTAKPGASNPPGFEKLKDNGAGSTGVFTYRFDASSLEEVFFEIQLPHAFREYRGDIRPHVHWCPTTTNTGTVRWGLEYAQANYLGTYGNTSIVYAEQAGSGTAYQHQIAQFTAIAATTFAISSILVCRLFRDAANGNDTYTGDAAALSFDFHIELDAMGSEREYIKRI